jgi:hypothetical protein
MNHITTTSSSTDILSMFVILSASLAALTLVIVHFLPTGVKPISEAVSDYGVGEYKNFYRLIVFWLGASGLLLSITLGKAIFPKPTLTILALLVFAAVRWVIIIFPTDLPDAEETDVGSAHVRLAQIAFVSIAIAAAFFPQQVHDDPLWHKYTGLLWVLAAAIAITAFATGLTRSFSKQFFGLAERMLYVSMFAWLITCAVILLSD